VTQKVIAIEIVVFDGYEAEAVNDVIGDFIEREEWMVRSWLTRDATPEEALWFHDSEREFVDQELERSKSYIYRAIE
jgi:hypothetical protein